MPTSSDPVWMDLPRLDPRVPPDTDTARRKGSGCPNPAMGCSREEYTVWAGDGYLRRGYDSGRWWVK